MSQVLLVQVCLKQTSDSFGIVGSIRCVKPAFNLIGLAAFCYGVISAHHISAGLNMGNVEDVLSTSLSPVFFTAFVMSAAMWYGSSKSVHELYGPSRYHWDNAYFALDIEHRSSLGSWSLVPDKLCLYDYIGCQPSKAGLFRQVKQLKVLC